MTGIFWTAYVTVLQKLIKAPYSYQENYSGYLNLKQERMDMAVAGERKRQSILRKEIAWMQRGARARSTKQKAHIKRYENLRDQSGPQFDKQMELSSVSSLYGKDDGRASSYQ